jgi:Uma2 family endonuclease
MLSILEERAIREAALPITPEQYHALGGSGLLPEQVELLQGVIVAKMPKTPLHVFVVRYLFGLLSRSVPPGYLVAKEDPLTLRDSETEPDLAIIHADENDLLHSNPVSAELVIEVAISSSSIDRQKASIYADAGIPEFWLLLPEERRIEVFSAPAGSTYQSVRICGGNEVVSPIRFPTIQFDLPDLFNRLP